MEQPITDGLNRFDSYISRIEVHFTDESNRKKCKYEKRCLIEARVNAHPPVAVPHHGDDLQIALRGALQKITKDSLRPHGRFTCIDHLIIQK